MVIQLFVMLVLSRKCLDRNDVTMQIDGAVDCANTVFMPNDSGSWTW